MIRRVCLQREPEVSAPLGKPTKSARYHPRSGPALRRSRGLNGAIGEVMRTVISHCWKVPRSALSARERLDPTKWRAEPCDVRVAGKSGRQRGGPSTAATAPTVTAGALGVSRVSARRRNTLKSNEPEVARLPPVAEAVENAQVTSWSPDDAQIVSQATRTAKASMDRTNADGTGLTWLAKPSENVTNHLYSGWRRNP